MAKKADAPAKIMSHPPTKAADEDWRNTFDRWCSCGIARDRGDGRCHYCAGKIPPVKPVGFSST